MMENHFDADMATAHRHMTIVARGLNAKFGPVRAAGLLIGAAAGVLLEDMGEATTVEWLRELADALERGEDLLTSEPGHA